MMLPTSQSRLEFLIELYGIDGLLQEMARFLFRQANLTEDRRIINGIPEGMRINAHLLLDCAAKIEK